MKDIMAVCPVCGRTFYPTVLTRDGKKVPWHYFPLPDGPVCEGTNQEPKMISEGKAE